MTNTSFSYSAMMIRDKILKLHRTKSDKNSGKRFDFSFSSFRARQVPKGWDRLSISLISVETGKTVCKSGKASVRNGSCQWTETWAQSVWLTSDDTSNKHEQCPFKLIITMGSARTSILGEVPVNLDNYRDAKAYTPVSLPLRKCNHGTVLQLEIKCLTAIWDNESKDMSMDAEEGSMDYNYLEKSEDKGFPRLSSYHIFSNTEDSLDTESVSSQSDSNRPVNLIIGRQESIDSRSSASCGSYSFGESPKSNNSPYNLMTSRSGKYAQNEKDDFRQLPHDNSESVQTAASSRNSLEGKDVTSKELVAAATMWEQNAQSLKIDLELSRKEFADQTQQIATLKMNLRSLGKERDGLMQEMKHLEDLLRESMEKEKQTKSLMLQVRDMDNVQKMLKEELRIQKESNDSLSSQLCKTQESNIQLVSILQEMEATIENQKSEIQNLLELKSESDARTVTDSSMHEESREVNTAPSAEKLGNLCGDLSPYPENQLDLEIKLQQLQESQIKLENTTAHMENIIREKTLEIELEQSQRTQALLDCEEKWKGKSNEQEEEIAYLKEELSRLLSEDSKTKAKVAADCDLVTENKTLKAKLQELERDYKKLTEENLELLSKLKSKETSPIGVSILSSSFVEDQLSELSLGGSQIEVSKGELLSPPIQYDMGKKKLIADTAASESKHIACDQEENSAQMSQVLNDKGSSLNAEINSSCSEVQEQDQITVIAAMPSQCQQQENCQGDLSHKNMSAIFQSSESRCIEDIYTLINTLGLAMKDEKANAALKKLFQLLRYRLALCLHGNKCIEDEQETTVQDAFEAQDGEKDDLEDLRKVLEVKVQNLSSGSLAKKSQILELKTDCFRNDPEIKDLRHQQTDFRSQISDLQMSKCLMDDRVGNAQQELMGADVSEMMLKMKSLESDKYELELALNELEKENVDLSERVSGLEAQLRHLTDGVEFHRLELQQSAIHVQNLQEKIRELEHEKESQKFHMSEKLEEMQRRWLDAQDEYQYLKKVNPQLQATTESLMEECHLLQNLNAELRQQKLKLHASRSILEADLRKSQCSFSSSMERIESLEAKFSLVLEEIESKESIFKFELDDLYRQTKEHNETLLEEKFQLHDLSPENTVEIEKLRKNVQSLMVQISDLSSELGTSKAKEEFLAANCEKLLKTIDRLLSNEARHKSTIDELESKLLSSDCQMLQATEENYSLKNQLQKLSLLQEEVLALKGELSGMKSKSERLQVSLQLKSEEYEELKAENTSLLQEISHMQKTVAEAEECKCKKIALEDKIFRLEGDLTAKEVMCGKVSELRNEICQLRRANSQFLWKIKFLQSENEACLKQVKSLQEELKRKQLEKHGDDDHSIPTPEVLKLSKADEEDIKKHQSEIFIQSSQSENCFKFQKIQQDGNKESNYNGDLQESVVTKSVSVIQFPGDRVAQTLESSCMDEAPLISLSSRGKDDNNMHRISQLEAELQEIRDRYLHMSLKYVEVEDQREQLVMTLKAMNDRKC